MTAPRALCASLARRAGLTPSASDRAIAREARGRLASATGLRALSVAEQGAPAGGGSSRKPIPAVQTQDFRSRCPGERPWQVFNDPRGRAPHDGGTP